MHIFYLLTCSITAPIQLNSETHVVVVYFGMYFEESCFKCPSKIVIFYGVAVPISIKCLKNKWK